ncbi:ABC transporter ATP-binding protein [Corynebacterium sp. S7]
MSGMIVVDRLSKRFKDVYAVRDLSFTVAEGSLFAFLGTNGAGKTTTISCLTTLLNFTEGTITVDGLRVGAEDHRIRERIGVVFQQSLLDPQLTALENLRLRAKFYGVTPESITEVVRQVDLSGFLNRRYGVLSGGEKRRVDIARALLHRPRVLVLDEPTTGLDPSSREQVWEAISHLRASLGLTVLLTTHYMHETEAADEVLVINRGQVLATGTPMELRAQHSTARLSLVAAPGGRQAIIAAVERLLPGQGWFEQGGAILADAPDSRAVRQLLTETTEAVADFQYIQGTMDDVFIGLTTDRKNA